MDVRAARVLLCAGAIAVPAAILNAQATVDPPGARRPASLAKPRVAPLPAAEWTEAQKELVAKFSRDGRADNGLATLLRLPEIAEGFIPYTIYLAESSSLSPRHRMLLILRSAWLTGNRPLWGTYAPLARSAGLAAAEIRRIAEGSRASGWSDFDVLLIRLADELYRNSSVTNATWDALAKDYDLFHLMDAVETVNHFTVLAMLYNSFGVQPDAGADRLPTDISYRVDASPREPPLTAARVTPGDGRGIAVGRTFNRYPTLVEAWSPRQRFVNRVSKLTPRHREMLILRMGWNCRSEYEWAQHVGIVGRAREHGLEPVRIAEGPRAAGWDEFDRVLLRVADDLYRDAMVSDDTWRQLTARFDTGLAMSAVATASAYRAISMSLNAYGVQLDPGNERFPAVN
jgi:4-carboxymuconolactone decarboxylase